jgi:hypothetical protein
MLTTNDGLNTQMSTWMDESTLEYYGSHRANEGILDVGYAMYESFQHELKLTGVAWLAMRMLVSSAICRLCGRVGD